MTATKYCLTLAWLVIAIVGSAALHAADAKPASAPAAAVRGSVENVSPETVLIRLGDDHTITQGDFEEAARGAMPTQYDRSIFDLVERRLFLLYLKEHPHLVSDADVEKTIDDAVPRGKTRKDLLETIAKSGVPLEMVKNMNRINLGVAALRSEGNRKAQDGQICKDLYDNQKEAFDGTEVKGRHIMFRVHPYETPAQREATRQKIEGIREQLIAGKMDWKQGILETNDQLLINSNGELGWFSRHFGVNEPMAEAAFKLKAGEISPVVQTVLGYHIIQLEDRHAGNRTFEDKNTTREITRWLEEEELYKAKLEVAHKHPVIGIRPPARTAKMASYEPNASAPATAASGSPSTRPAHRKN